MTGVMEGVRVLEVAEHTFVPAASAILADWGAEVIKVEHVERGDAMRGLAQSGLAIMGSDVHVLLEHSNRGKQSIGLDLSSTEGISILYRIAATCDVFLTNKLRSTRERLGIEVDDIRQNNPEIIYVRGTGYGARGPDQDKGGYDMLAYWSRAGSAIGTKAPEARTLPAQPAPAYGDSIGAMTIAGGISAALFHRERTGEATVVDVSLLGVGMWAMGAAIALSLQNGQPWLGPSETRVSSGNPLVGTYQTSDGRFIALSCLQAIVYWPSMCETIGYADLAADPRFNSHDTLSANAVEASQILAEVFASAPLQHWAERLVDFSGQWSIAQDTLEAANDPQTEANGYVLETCTADGTPFKLVTTPVQFDEQPTRPARAPLFNEHGDSILGDLGIDWDQIIDLKVRGIIA